MRFGLKLIIVLLFFASTAAMAQRPPQQQEHPQQATHPNPPRANQGRIPPPPPKTHVPHGYKYRPEEEHRQDGAMDRTPHVNNDHWYGHDHPSDKRYHFDRPFEHGHLEHFGPTFRYNVVRIDRDHRRFWFPGGYYFEIAAWDWPIAGEWCWDCGDDFVVYEDPDHFGWYLLYNIHTGVYVHVYYLGS